MADVQIENGYVRVANELLAALAKAEIRGSEFMIILFIISCTYGYNKTKDNISLRQFSEATLKDRANCARSIRNLIRMNIIGSVKGDSTSSSTYWIQKDYDKWDIDGGSVKKVVSKVGVVSKVPVRVVSEVVSMPYINTTIQQKTIKQKTSIEPKVVSPTKIVQDFFYKQHLEALGEPYVADFGKDGAIFKSLLNVLSADRVKQLIMYFFKSDDDFIRKAGYTVGVFKSQINKLRTPGGSSLAVLELEEMMKNDK